MRPLNNNTIVYQPERVPTDINQVPMYLERELSTIARIVEQLAAGHIEVAYVAPVKPREGDFRLADGTEWNPGAGAGFYGYYGGAWVKLG